MLYGMLLSALVILFFAFYSIRGIVQVSRHRATILELGLSIQSYHGLCLSPVLFITSLLCLFATPWFGWLIPGVAGLLLVVPGIVLGRRAQAFFDRAGVALADDPGRIAGNITWLGLGIAIYIIAGIALRMIYASVSHPLS